MTKAHFTPNPDQPDRCQSMDPWDSGLQCTRRAHDDDQCQSGGIAWKKGIRYLSEREAALDEVTHRLREVFGPLCAEHCPHVGCQAQHIVNDVRVRVIPPVPSMPEEGTS